MASSASLRLGSVRAKPDPASATRQAVDLRLALPAAVTWLLTAITLGWPKPFIMTLAASLATLAGVALAAARRPAASRRPWLASAALASGVAAVALVGLGVRVALAEASPLVAAARSKAEVWAELTISQAPRPVGSGLSGGARLVMEGQAWPVEFGPSGKSSNPAGETDLRRTGRSTEVVAFVDASAWPGVVDQSTDLAEEGAGQTLAVRAALAGPTGTQLLVLARASPAAAGERARVILTVKRVIAATPPSGWRAVVAHLRGALVERASTRPPDQAGLVAGLAVGETANLPTSLDQAMRVTSLKHLTAVSGTHVAVVVGTCLMLGAVLRLPRPGRAVLAALALSGFVALVGPSPSVLRSAAMGAVLLAALIQGRRRVALAGLALAVVVLLILDPWLARAYGFVMSCAATVGLILLAPGITRQLKRYIGHRWAAAVAVPIAAQVACAPILVLLAPQVSLVGVPANLLVMPAVPVITLGGLAACLLGVIAPPLAQLALLPASWAASWVATVARSAASLPGAAITWPGGWLGALALAATTVLALVAGRWCLRHRVLGRALLSAALVAVIGAVVALTPAGSGLIRALVSRASPSDWAVAVCDVGQGTGVAIRTGPKSAVLADTGPEGGSMHRCLTSLGVDQLDAIILSHLHADHAGGLDEVSGGRQVGLIVAPLICGAASAEPALAKLANQGVPVMRLSSQQRSFVGQAGTVQFEVWPSPLDGRCRRQVSESRVNDASLAVHVAIKAPSAGQFDLWQLGDLESEGQRALAATLRKSKAAGNNVSTGGVVVVAHHGSARQDPGLAKLLDPVLAIYSSGQGNTYGHPAKTALDLYGQLGSQLARTDICGTVTLTVSGQSSCPRYNHLNLTGLIKDDAERA